MGSAGIRSCTRLLLLECHVPILDGYTSRKISAAAEWRHLLTSGRLKCDERHKCNRRDMNLVRQAQNTFADNIHLNLIGVTIDGHSA